MVTALSTCLNKAGIIYGMDQHVVQIVVKMRSARTDNQLLSIVCPVFFPYQNFHTNTCVHVLSIYAFLLIRFLLQSRICGTYCNLALVLWYNFIQQKDHPHGEFCAGGTIGYKLYSPNWVNMQHFVFIAVKI